MKAKYVLVVFAAVLCAGCEKNFFETDSPSAMDVSVFKSTQTTEQAVYAIYNIFGEDKSFRNSLELLLFLSFFIIIFFHLGYFFFNFRYFFIRHGFYFIK